MDMVVVKHDVYIHNMFINISHANVAIQLWRFL